MTLHEVVAAFQKLPFAHVGCGPRHPRTPNVGLRTKTDDFVQANPALQQHPDWIEFLQTYSGASIDTETTREYPMLCILGFDAGGPLEDEFDAAIREELCPFASIIAPLESRSVEQLPPPSASYSFVFDLSGNRDSGVLYDFQVDPDRKRSPITRYCDTFLDWLAEVVACGGRAEELNAKWLPHRHQP